MLRRGSIHSLDRGITLSFPLIGKALCNPRWCNIEKLWRQDNANLIAAVGGLLRTSASVNQTQPAATPQFNLYEGSEREFTVFSLQQLLTFNQMISFKIILLRCFIWLFLGLRCRSNCRNYPLGCWEFQTCKSRRLEIVSEWKSKLI